MENHDGQIVRVFRLQKELTQEQFANQIGVSRVMINLIEKGRCELSRNVAKKIHEAFNDFEIPDPFIYEQSGRMQQDIFPLDQELPTIKNLPNVEYKFPVNIVDEEGKSKEIYLQDIYSDDDTRVLGYDVIKEYNQCSFALNNVPTNFSQGDTVIFYVFSEDFEHTFSKEQPGLLYFSLVENGETNYYLGTVKKSSANVFSYLQQLDEDARNRELAKLVNPEYAEALAHKVTGYEVTQYVADDARVLFISQEDISLGKAGFEIIGRVLEIRHSLI